MHRQDDLLQLWTELLRTQYACVRVADEVVSLAGVSLPTYEILYRLSRVPERRLAATLLLTPSGLSRAVVKGEQQGLLERKQDGEDERGRVCELTPKGHALLRELQPNFFRVLEKMFASVLSPDEVKTATSLLEKVRSRAM